MGVVYPYVKNTTWADGAGGATPDTAAKKNIIEDGIFNAHNPPAVNVTHNANQSITHATATALALNTERYDQAGGAASTQHDNSTNNSRLTCRYAGVYSMKGAAEYASNATGTRELHIRLNGSTILCKDQEVVEASAGVVCLVTISMDYLLAVNDYVELLAYQTSGVSLNVNTQTWSPVFSMKRVA